MFNLILHLVISCFLLSGAHVVRNHLFSLHHDTCFRCCLLLMSLAVYCPCFHFGTDFGLILYRSDV
jgi:hypothetical protein